MSCASTLPAAENHKKQRLVEALKAPGITHKNKWTEKGRGQGVGPAVQTGGSANRKFWTLLELCG